MTLAEYKQPDMESGLPATLEKHEPIPEEWHLRCIHCDYDLTGVTYRRCPECGRRFDLDETMRLNKRTTWEYLLENRGTALGYPILVLLKKIGFSPRTANRLFDWSGPVFYTLLTFIGIGFLVLSLLEPLSLFGLFLLVPAEVYVLITRRGQGLFRLSVWILCLLWALIINYI